MKIFKAYYKTLKKIYFEIINRSIFQYYNISYPDNIRINGILNLSINKNGSLKIGSNLILNSNYQGNVIGRQQPCIISVSRDAVLTIGNNVGMSSTAIIATKKIKIGDNVRIGGDTCIYDTDFHSLFVDERAAIPEITANVKKKEVIIEDNVFIGASVTILKGAIIGKNSIIGACSVVTKNIPPNEIWAGNPAKFISKVPIKE